MSGSRPLYADRAALRSYLDRGYAVRRVEVRYWRVHVLVEADQVVRLEVADRLGPVSVRSPGGAVRVLPADRPSRHLITLAATRAGWRISAIRAL